jgi:hypothetical protein
MSPRSSLEMRLALHRSLRSFRMCQLVSFYHRLEHIVLANLKSLFSHAYHSPRPVYTCGHSSDVQDFGPQLSHHRI